MLRAHHDDSISISAAKGEGLDGLEQAVRAALLDRALDAEVETDVADGRVLAYLAQHAQIQTGPTTRTATASSSSAGCPAAASTSSTSTAPRCDRTDERLYV